MLVTTTRSGRLGNRLQLAAYVMAAALECETTAALLCLGPYRRLFAGAYDDPLCRIPERQGSLAARVAVPLLRATAGWSGLPRLSARRYPGLVLDRPDVLDRLRAHPTALLDGYYFYAPSLLRAHAATIRGYFRLASPFASPVAQLVARSRQRADRIVGIHVRHGDYASYLGGEHYFSIEDYAGLMRELEALLHPATTHFIVCSDAVQPDRVFAGMSWERGPGRVVEDLYALAGCDYVMGPRSTFNRWSAFVGNVPRHEVRTLGRKLSLADFTPPEDLTVPEPTPPAA